MRMRHNSDCTPLEIAQTQKNRICQQALQWHSMSCDLILNMGGCTDDWSVYQSSSQVEIEAWLVGVVWTICQLIAFPC